MLRKNNKTGFWARVTGAVGLCAGHLLPAPSDPLSIPVHTAPGLGGSAIWTRSKGFFPLWSDWLSHWKVPAADQKLESEPGAGIYLLNTFPVRQHPCIPLVGATTPKICRFTHSPIPGFLLIPSGPERHNPSLLMVMSYLAIPCCLS